MKKIRRLQVLVYIAFALFFIQNGAADALRGFKEGVRDGMDLKSSGFTQGLPLHPVIDGSFITHQANGELRIGDDYIMGDINITSEVRINADRLVTPWIIRATTIVLMLSIIIIMGKMAYTINRVIQNITEGNMFEPEGIKQVKNIGMLLLMYSLVDFGYQLIIYYEQKLLIHSPLKVVNTSSFNFVALIIAILVFIIAEAFKQGAKLKENEALTI
jgi:hypothetical protein